MRHWNWSKFILGGTEVQDFSQFAYQLSLRYVEVSSANMCRCRKMTFCFPLTGACLRCVNNIAALGPLCRYTYSICGARTQKNFNFPFIGHCFERNVYPDQVKGCN